MPFYHVHLFILEPSRLNQSGFNIMSFLGNLLAEDDDDDEDAGRSR